MHHCVNVVDRQPTGDGQAVLLRGVVPLTGLDELRARRPGHPDRRLADGPGKLCQAFGIDRRHDGLDLDDRPRRASSRRTTASPTPVDQPRPASAITKATDRPVALARSLPSDRGLSAADSVEPGHNDDPTAGGGVVAKEPMKDVVVLLAGDPRQRPQP